MCIVGKRLVTTIRSTVEEKEKMIMCANYPTFNIFKGNHLVNIGHKLFVCRYYSEHTNVRNTEEAV